MAKTINAAFAKEFRHAFTVPPDQIIVKQSDNTRMFDPDVSDLIAAFKADGQMQPVGVREVNEKKLQLVFGFRRWLAATAIAKEQAKAGIPPEDRFKLICIIQRLSVEEAFEQNIKENAIRQTLSPVEEAHAIRRLRNLRGWKDSEGTKKVAELFHRSTQWVESREEFLKLSEKEQAMLHMAFKSHGESGLSISGAEALMEFDEEQRKQLLEQALASQEIEGNENPEQHTEEEAGANSSKKKKKAKPAKKAKAVTAKDIKKAAAKTGTKTSKSKSGASNDEAGMQFGAKKGIKDIRELFDPSAELEGEPARAFKTKMTLWLNGSPDMDDASIHSYIRRSLSEAATRII